MRVVAGTVKGHHLQAPRGLETRPTSDKVREAIFSILAGIYEGEMVLDLFAGTGALGIEAMSRGADGAVFVERRPQACAAIRANLQHTRLEARGRVVCAPVERVLGGLEDGFGLILLDPPYAYPGLDGIMTTVGVARVLRKDTSVVFEHSPRVAVADSYGKLHLWRRKVYGDTAVSIYVVREEQSE